MRRRRPLALATSAMIALGLIPPALSVTTASPSITAAAEAATASRTTVRVASFNVRTARATQDSRSWTQRAPSVAREILSRNPGVVALQELGPGRADGRKGTTKGTPRQTTSLVSALKAQGGGRYRLVRSTPYPPPGTAHGTQGTRILYDSSRYALVSRCSDYTGKRAHSFSCAFDLPLAAGDSAQQRRAAGYAALRDRRTGKGFFVVSAHLDSRHSKSSAKEGTFNALRARQAAAVASKLASVNPRGWPVVFGGDINSWQTDRGRYAPHRALAARGYRDAVTAPRRVNFAYPTINHFKTTQKASKSKTGGVRLDVIMVKGARSFSRYENKVVRVSSSRPSDHNMVLGDIVL